MPNTFYQYTWHVDLAFLGGGVYNFLGVDFVFPETRFLVKRPSGT